MQFAADDNGRPIFAFSSLSGHTRDLRSDPRCSLTVSSPTFRVRACASARSLLGRAMQRAAPQDTISSEGECLAPLSDEAMSPCAVSD